MFNTANGTEFSGETDEQVAKYLNNLTAAAGAVPPAILNGSTLVDQADRIQMTAVACGGENLSEERDDFDYANSLNLNLQTDGLAFQLQTRAPLTPQLVALTTRLEVALDRLQETDGRLGNAIYRIGYLEAQLAEREREIEGLRRTSLNQ
jgi:methylphosphotriester-DNA--protein-cysteine methyltransferase